MTGGSRDEIESELDEMDRDIETARKALGRAARAIKRARADLSGLYAEGYAEGVRETMERDAR